MLESGYQSKIIKGIIADGGTAITGKLKTGEADIQAGYPVEVGLHTLAFKNRPEGYITFKTVLLKLTVEVKTPKAYAYLMQGVEEVNGLYVVTNPTKLKEHEELQIHKLNNVRKRGGLALIAHSYEQVKEYINGKV